MNEIVLEKLKAYRAKSLEDERQALREIIQEIALLGLWRAKFFEHAAFYGGTALRILYGLDRFSEDLDFTLRHPVDGFTLGTYGTALQEELLAFGFEVTIQLKEKNTDIESAFIKANTLQHLLKVSFRNKTHRNEILNVKLEIDTKPALPFGIDTKPFFWPMLFSVTSCDLPSLFSGKMHAVLCRERVVNTKGRDWYDFLWYIGRSVPLNLQYLEAKLRASGAWSGHAPLGVEAVQGMLVARIDTLDVEAAKKDVMRFIADSRRLEGWSREAFRAAASRLTGV